MTRPELFLVLGAVLAVLGAARLLLTDDLVRRVVGLNIASGGVLMVIIAVGYDGESPDPVTHALALTGIVITVSVTAFALALARRIEDDDAAAADDGTAASDEGTPAPDDGTSASDKHAPADEHEADR